MVLEAVVEALTKLGILYQGWDETALMWSRRESCFRNVYEKGVLRVGGCK
jgi:hypothetical protein